MQHLAWFCYSACLIQWTTSNSHHPRRYINSYYKYFYDSNKESRKSWNLCNCVHSLERRVRLSTLHCGKHLSQCSAACCTFAQMQIVYANTKCTVVVLMWTQPLTLDLRAHTRLILPSVGSLEYDDDEHCFLWKELYLIMLCVKVCKVQYAPKSDG